MTTNPMKDAADILETEANQLAHLVDDKAFAQMNYRVEIAVQAEMKRLRAIASHLRAQLPVEDES